MREFIHICRNIYLITRTLEQRLALVPCAQPRRRLSLTKFLMAKKRPPVRDPHVWTDS